MATLSSSLLVKLIDGVSGPAKAAAGSLRGIGAAARGINGVQARLGAAIERNNAALAAARGRLFDAVAAGYALKRGLEAPVRAAMDFESAMADVRKVVDFDSAGQFKDFQKAVLDMSKRLPMAAQGLSEIIAAAGQAGIARGDLLKFAEMAAKVGVAFDISADQTGEALAKMMTGLGISIDEVGLLADAMNHLSNAQASSAADILDVVRRVGAQSKQFGFNAIEVSAFASAMLSAGAESEVAATSFRNMGRALTRGTSATKRQHAAYKKLGLDATKVAKRMQQDAVTTTVDVLERISKLPKEIQASVSSDLFGDEARALGPLLTNLDLVRKSLGLVAKESDYAGSATREYMARAATFANRLQLFQNKLTALGVNLGNALIPALTQIMDAIAPFIERLSDLAEKYPDLTAKIVAAAAALIGFKVALAGLSFLGLMGKGGALSMLALSFGAISKAGTPVLGFFQTLALRARLATAATGRAPGVFARLGDAMLVLGRGLTAFPSGILTTIGNGLARLGWVGALAATAGFLIYQNWSGLKEFFASFGAAFEKGIAPIQPTIDRLRSMFSGPVFDTIGNALRLALDPIGAAVDKLAPLAGYLTASDAAWASWGETLGGGVAEALNKVVSAIGSVIDGFRSAYNAAVDLAGAVKNLAGFGAGPAANDMPAYNAAGDAIPARASGGPLDAHQATLVGERGPEIITASRSGYVHPNESLGGGSGFKQINHITINGVAGDLRKIARAVEDAIDAKTRELYRGAQADLGFT